MLYRINNSAEVKLKINKYVSWVRAEWMDSIHLESIHMPIDFQYAEAVRNIAQAYLELINTQDKDGFIEQVQVCFQTYGSPQR